jgi:type II secretory pathway component PulJ
MIKGLSNKNRGMTLAETLIALAIFVAVIVAVGSFQVSIFSNQRTVAGSLQTAQDSQVILKTMLTELRSAVPGMNGAYPIVSAATSSLSFFSDVDRDGSAEQITYTLIGNVLYRATIQPTGSPVVYNPAQQATSSILYNVRNATTTPVFQYYDQNYTGTSSPLTIPVNISAVRLISIRLYLDVYVNQAPAVRSYTAQVSLRNLKSNL